MGEKVITIFGTGSAKSDDAAYKLAYEMGKLLAQAGFTISQRRIWRYNVSSS